MQRQTLHIEVALVTSTEQLIIPLEVPISCNIMQAIQLSDIKNRLSDATKLQLQQEKFDWNNLNLGIFGKKIDKNKYELQNNDRIEIYRTLLYTPNQRRLERLAKNGK